MRVQFDNIDALLDEMLATLKGLPNNVVAKQLYLLGQLKGICNMGFEDLSRWDVIREDYEKGEPPRKLAKLFNVSVKDIYNRAYCNQWTSPAKQRKAMRPIKNKAKYVFYPNCIKCEHPFEAYTGSASVCPTCKAYKAKGQAR